MLVITPKDLKDAVARVKTAADPRSAVSVFAAIRFYVAGDASESYIEASTHEHACRRMLDNQSMHMGGLDALVHTKYVDKALKVFAKANEITVRAEDEGVVFSSGTRKVVAPAEAREDWLEASFESGPRLLMGEAKPVHASLLKALAFSSNDQTRPMLCAVSLDLHPKEGAHFVATDSYRLGIFPTGAHETLVPGEYEQHSIDGLSLAKVAKGLKGAETVELYMPNEVEGRWYVAVLDDGRELWQIRSTDGRYPNWRQLIPDEHTFEVELTLQRAGLVSAVEAAKIIAERNAPLRLAVNGNVRVTVRQPGAAELDEELQDATVKYLSQSATDAHAGDGQEYGYNPEFLLDVAKTVGDGEEIRLSAISPLRPVLVQSDDDRALLMPIRLNV